MGFGPYTLSCEDLGHFGTLMICQEFSDSRRRHDGPHTVAGPKPQQPLHTLRPAVFSRSLQDPWPSAGDESARAESGELEGAPKVSRAYGVQPKAFSGS